VPTVLPLRMGNKYPINIPIHNKCVEVSMDDK
jgi:hypothetical protein